MKKPVEKSDNKLKELEKKIKELTHSWKRALADYQNLERRVREEKEQFAKYAKGSLIEKILPSLDSLDKVSQHIKDEGLNISIKTLKDALTTEGLKEIDPLGQEFNPETMEAVELVNGEDGKVIGVHQKGYLLYDRVLKPAKVKIGKKKVSNIFKGV